jgi:hypothetical protein
MNVKKYGFVYIWFDKKRKMYYIGSHWGSEDDGYICSSNRMRMNYTYRPDDFRRKIIEKVFSDRNELYIKEQKWLMLIKKEELGKKYYNMLLETKPFFTTKGKFHSDETKLKISKAAKSRKPMTEETKQKIRIARANQVFTEESKEKKKKSLLKFYETQTHEQRNERLSSARKWFDVPENKIIISKSRSETAKRLRREGKLGRKSIVCINKTVD